MAPHNLLRSRVDLGGVFYDELFCKGRFRRRPSAGASASSSPASSKQLSHDSGLSRSSMYSMAYCRAASMAFSCGAFLSNTRRAPSKDTAPGIRRRPHRGSACSARARYPPSPCSRRVLHRTGAASSCGCPSRACRARASRACGPWLRASRHAPCPCFARGRAPRREPGWRLSRREDPSEGSMSMDLAKARERAVVRARTCRCRCSSEHAKPEIVQIITTPPCPPPQSHTPPRHFRMLRPETPREARARCGSASAPRSRVPAGRGSGGSGRATAWTLNTTVWRADLVSAQADGRTMSCHRVPSGGGAMRCLGQPRPEAWRPRRPKAAGGGTAKAALWSCCTSCPWPRRRTPRS